MSNTGYRGVYRKKNGTIFASLWDGKTLLHVGMFSTPYMAARARDHAAWKLRGGKAKMNFPPMLNR